MDNSTTAASIDTAALMPVILIWAALVVLMVVSMWRVFSKAGQPGWAAIVPIYNIYVMCQIARKPGWWVLLFFIPLVNVVFSIIVTLGVARAFGKGGAFGFFALCVFPFVGYPMLAFGNATHVGAVTPDETPVPATV